MKKRCTNPTCRSVFSLRAGMPMTVCPRCGKRYPRIAQSPALRIRLLSVTRGRQRIELIKLCRDLLGISLHESAVLIHQLPKAVTLPLMAPEQTMNTVRELDKIGVPYALIPQRGPVTG